MSYTMKADDVFGLASAIHADVRQKGDELFFKYCPYCDGGTSHDKETFSINLESGGFIQVGYDAEQFHEMLDEFVIDVTKNRHVGTGGFVAVCDENLRSIKNPLISIKYSLCLLSLRICTSTWLCKTKCTDFLTTC